MYINVIYEDGGKKWFPINDTMTVNEVTNLVNVFRVIPKVKDVYVNVKDPNYEKNSDK